MTAPSSPSPGAAPASLALVDASLLDHVVIEAPLLHHGGIGAVRDEDVKGVTQHLAQRRALGHDRALVDVLEAVGEPDAREFELAVGLLHEIGERSLRR